MSPTLPSVSITACRMTLPETLAWRAASGYSGWILCSSWGGVTSSPTTRGLRAIAGSAPTARSRRSRAIDRVGLRAIGAEDTRVSIDAEQCLEDLEHPDRPAHLVVGKLRGLTQLAQGDRRAAQLEDPPFLG